jgi:hypothetical protein
MNGYGSILIKRYDGKQSRTHTHTTQRTNAKMYWYNVIILQPIKNIRTMTNKQKYFLARRYNNTSNIPLKLSGYCQNIF